jgi:3-oxoadipate CoA-transferase beta subunit
MTFVPFTRDEIAANVGKDLPDGAYVNLGIGMPTLVANNLPFGIEIVIHSENGVLGVGPKPLPGLEDPELIDAGKDFITLLKGASIFHHTDSFLMMRGGHLDIAILGSFQVSQCGDLANWATNDTSFPPAVGGAMDLAVGAKKIFVMTTHTTKDGIPKLLKKCTFPLTAKKVVNTVYSDLATIDIRDGNMYVRNMVPNLKKEELQLRTDAELIFDF